MNKLEIIQIVALALIILGLTIYYICKAIKNKWIEKLTDTIKKAIQDANKNIIQIPLIDGRTISHETIGTSGAARVILKPAKAGTGIIAGGSVRAVLELAGVRDIVSKALGARTKLNMAQAAINGLKSIKTPEEVAKLRGKTVEEILG